MGYPKQVYDQAWQVMDTRARAARERAAARREQALRATPEIAAIEREMAVGATGITKAVVTNPQRAGELIEELAKQNLALQERRAELLKLHGFPPDYLAEQFGCPLCKDQGYVGTRMCGCLKSLLESEAYARLSAAAPVSQCTFENFSLEYYPAADQPGGAPRARMGEILAYCRRYADGFSPDTESLLLLGKTGLGKTHLSLAIAATVTRRGFGVVYTPVQNLMDTLESTKFSYDSGKKEEYADHVRAAITCDLLVLDDLGTEFATQFSQSALYNIINSRQVENRPTIISTNLELAEIEQKYTQRMVSRLAGSYKVLKFTGKDIRFIKKTLGK